MSGTWRRSIADLACRALQSILPPSMQCWGRAVRCETAAIPDDTDALLFALDSLVGLLPRALALLLLHPFAALTGKTSLSSGGLNMTLNEAASRPRAIGIACAIGAVTLGLCYMAAADAPARYLGTNIGALAIGLTMLALLGRTLNAGWQRSGGAIAAMAGVLLATALLGNAADGAARWVSLAGLSIQPSLVLIPLMIVTFARSRSVLATAGIIAAATALALQPDRAMAGMLAVSLAILLLMRPDRHAIAAFAAGIASFAITLVRPDALVAVPYVDQVLYTSFDVHLAAGAAVLGGTALLLVPAIVGWYRDRDNRLLYAAFGAAWLAGIMAAALGNYPTLIVGYGGSAIIGYALSLLALPKLATEHAGAGSAKPVESEATSPDGHLRIGLA